MALKHRIARFAASNHRWLARAGAASLLIWGLSALAHIAMVLGGPQQAVFMPPRAPLDLAGARPVAATLAAAGIDRAAVVRTVAGPSGTLWQVTTAPAAPRRYFDPRTGAELRGHDRAQAIFIARHFLGERRPVADIALQNGFDGDYPWVNRLLPVWRIRFAGDDRLTAYVHTETSSLAAVNNRTKTALQAVFRLLHNWDWVPPGLSVVRVAVITVLVGGLVVLAVTGMAMLATVRRGKRPPGARGWHRQMAWLLALPLFLFAASGIWHLLTGAIAPPASQMRLAPPVQLAGSRFPVEAEWRALTAGRTVDHVSLVEGPGGRALYRLGLARDASAQSGGEHDHGGHARAEATPALPRTAAEIRAARFDGVQPTGPALYIDAASGKPWADGDRALARMIAGRFSGAPDSAITGMRLITRFGPDYDFRNKRLPVWRVDYGAPVHATLFIDTATGALADRVADWQKPERLAFSLAHKWNFLFPLGRTAMNVIVGLVVLLLIAGLAVPGLILDRKARAAARNRAAAGRR
ncbi:hypothetical protein GVO57_00965 [Sphingomonas changnyeongensis]|uniref:PepSY domain-containing protein n=1 Tax=Sphingomonas changnyeongensis TaxID=2698679 RepID=A0A7Z2NUF9_9SPHN|nr:hypothetical protein [Sphingomonas changnyeongensis]QHL89651.1 hypothetical protein GVO57_00965 [Sphingomonas changnyeongensis]